MFTVTPIPAFNDNYIWAISKPGNSSIVVVDPGDALPVLSYLQEHNLELAAILITHHHNDHTGGVKELTGKYNVSVYGPTNSRFDGITDPLKTGDSVQILGSTLKVQEVPGHTLDHISYFSDQELPQLFCGDTLFLAGCGRLFEGTAEQMLAAMNYFKALPDNTEVYCTHEYSLANLAFAAAVEPDNAEISSSTQNCERLREESKPTLPSSIGQEKQINPFMRTQHEDVIKAAQQFSGRATGDEVDVFASIREWKNQF